jgi:hypothetical protein
MRPHEPIRVHEDVLVFVCDRPFRAPSSGQWKADQVLAHLVAIDRMVAVAAAELFSGGVPVVDNRAARSVTYLDAIMATTGRRDDLLQTLDQAGREVALLADQLDDTHRGTNVPTIVVAAGAVRVQQPRRTQCSLSRDDSCVTSSNSPVWRSDREKPDSFQAPRLPIPTVRIRNTTKE